MNQQDKSKKKLETFKNKLSHKVASKQQLLAKITGGKQGNDMIVR